MMNNAACLLRRRCPSWVRSMNGVRSHGADCRFRIAAVPAICIENRCVSTSSSGTMSDTPTPTYGHANAHGHGKPPMQRQGATYARRRPPASSDNIVHTSHSSHYAIYEWLYSCMGTIPSGLSRLASSATFEQCLEAASHLRPAYPFGIAPVIHIIRTESCTINRNKMMEKLLIEDTLNSFTTSLKRLTQEAFPPATSTAISHSAFPAFTINGMLWLLLECCKMASDASLAVPLKLQTRLQDLAQETASFICAAGIQQLSANTRVYTLQIWCDAVLRSSMDPNAPFISMLLRSLPGTVAGQSGFYTCHYIAACGSLSQLIPKCTELQQSRDLCMPVHDSNNVALLASECATAIHHMDGESTLPSILVAPQSTLQWLNLLTRGFLHLRLPGDHPLWRSVVDYCFSHSEMLVNGDVQICNQLLESLNSVADLPQDVQWRWNAIVPVVMGVQAAGSEMDLDSASRIASSMNYRGEQDALAWQSMTALLKASAQQFGQEGSGIQLMQLHNLLRSSARIISAMGRCALTQRDTFELLASVVPDALALLRMHPLPDEERASIILSHLKGAALHVYGNQFASLLLEELKQDTRSLYAIPPGKLIRALVGLASKGILSEPLFKTFAKVIDQQLKSVPLSDLAAIIDAVLVAQLMHSGKPAHVARFCLRTIDQACNNLLENNFPPLSSGHLSAILSFDSILRANDAAFVLHPSLKQVQLGSTSRAICFRRLKETASSVRSTALMNLLSPTVRHVADALGWRDASTHYVTPFGLVLDLAWPSQKLCIELLEPQSRLPSATAADMGKGMLDCSLHTRHGIGRLYQPAGVTSSATFSWREDTWLLHQGPLNPYVEFRQRLLRANGWRVVQVPSNKLDATMIRQQISSVIEVA